MSKKSLKRRTKYCRLAWAVGFIYGTGLLILGLIDPRILRSYPIVADFVSAAPQPIASILQGLLPFLYLISTLCLMFSFVTLLPSATALIGGFIMSIAITTEALLTGKPIDFR